MGGPSGVPPCPRRPRVESTSGGPAGGGRVRRRAARQDRPPLRPLRRRRAPARLVGGGEPGRQGRARRHLLGAGHGGRPAGRARHQVPRLLHDQAGPLGLTDTDFWAGEDPAKDLAALYVPEPGSRRALRYDALGQVALRPPKALLGGQGLISTAADYHRFTQLLLRGGELDGTRLLGTRTLRYMTRNHLPGNADLEAFGRPLFAETTFDGVGFGLGFSVLLDPVANKVPSSVGEFAWGGAASTAFWVDPAERITVLFLTQLLPSATHPIRPELRQLVYQALVDD